MTIRLTNVHGTKAIDTKLYSVELLDQVGKKHLVKVFRLEAITGPIPTIQYGNLKYQFSEEIQSKWDLIVQRPNGKMVELLVGSEVASLHPTYLEMVGDIVGLKSRFGAGYAMYGTTSEVSMEKLNWSATAAAMRIGGVVMSHLKMCYSEEREHHQFKEVDVQLEDSQDLKSQASQQVHRTVEQQELDIWAAEQLGCEAPRQCKICRGCKDCSFRGQQMSQQEAWEYSKMEEGVQFEPNRKVFCVKYLFIHDPRKLSNNKGQVLRMGEILEQRLERDNLTEAANTVFQNIVEAGALVEAVPEELRSWNGPQH
jgi:hypothetical protein